MALDWFRSHPSNRKQFIQYKDSKLSTYTIPYGVPWGSVLGPLLFIVYTKDLPNCLIQCKSILSANDTTVYLTAKDIPTMFKSLNFDLECLTEGFRANNLSLNLWKTNYAILKTGCKPLEKKITFKIGNEAIERIVL